MITIKLEFSKSETGLAGFPYGETVYNNQVPTNISLDDKIEIVFPEQIEKVASSFVQGFFSKIIAVLGYKGIREKIIIKTKSESLTKSIWKNIY